MAKSIQVAADFLYSNASISNLILLDAYYAACEQHVTGNYVSSNHLYLARMCLACIVSYVKTGAKCDLLEADYYYNEAV